MDGGPQVEQLGIAGEVASLLSDGGVARLEADMPDEWIDQMAVVGTPEQCAAAIRALADAGADSVVLVPPEAGADPQALGRALLPLLT